MLAEISRLISMTEGIGVKQAIATKVETRVKSGKCLLCETTATRRGLCFRHYATYLRRLRERRSGQEQVRFETAAIREGKVLAVNQMRRLKSTDPFADL